MHEFLSICYQIHSINVKEKTTRQITQATLIHRMHGEQEINKERDTHKEREILDMHRLQTIFLILF